MSVDTKYAHEWREEPAQLDFVIESYEEVRTSAGIFYWDGETLVVRAPVPGEPRPQEFKGDDKDDKKQDRVYAIEARATPVPR